MGNKITMWGCCALFGLICILAAFIEGWRFLGPALKLLLVLVVIWAIHLLIDWFKRPTSPPQGPASPTPPGPDAAVPPTPPRGSDPG